MNLSTWNITLRYLQWIGLAIVAVGLPFSNFLMSFGMFWMAGVLVCMLTTDIATGKSILPRWQRFTSNSNALALSALFILPLIGLLWTTDFKYAAWDLRMKVPILALPLLISMLEPLTQGQFRALIGVFILAVITAVLWCLQVYWTSGPEIENDVRQISVFISHVRFSLLIALALGLLVRFAHGSMQGRLLIALVAIPSLYFIYVIGSVTGVLVLLALAFWMAIRFLFVSKSTWLKVSVVAAMIATMVFGSMAVSSAYHHYFDVEPMEWETLDATTPRGEEYQHHNDYPFVEDGYYVMTYIAWGELYDAWFTRSLIHPDSLDARGHVLKGTLIRYLASKGLRKDADGIAALSNDDVKAIEMGIPTIQDGKKHGLEKRLDRIFFEWSNYRAGGDPNGHSVLQRWEFWKTGWSIITAHPLTGVGTGDVKSAFNQAYIDNHSPLQQEFRLRAHNQYLTMWITYGIGGLIVFLVVLCWPLFHGYRKDVMVVMFLILAWLSCITEDTLESQAGVMFFAFFYALFTSKRELSLAELGRVKSKAARPSSGATQRK
jgi:hypothetical protein